MENQNSSKPNSLENELVVLALALCMAAFLCWLFFDSIVYWTSWILYWLWMTVDVPYIHGWVAGKINLLAATANRAAVVTFEEWLAVMNQGSVVLLFFLTPLVLVSSYCLARHPKAAFRSKRVVSIHTLPKMLGKFAPAVLPVLASTGRDGLMNDTSEENAWGWWPEEFAERHKLVSRQVLNRAAAVAVFSEQVGRPFESLDDLQPHEQAIFAVIGAQVFLDDRSAAKNLLDDLNRSCVASGLFTRKTSFYVPKYSLAQPLLERLKDADGVAEWMNTHGYVRSALCGLYARDLRLPPAQFRWLKCVDRTLWYGLQTADTASVFVEGSGIAAQARAEVRAREKGLPRPGLMVDKAVDGLQDDLESIGLVHPLESPEARRRRRNTDSALSAMYSAAGAVESDE